MTEFIERLELVTLRAVSYLLWPEREFDLTDDVRVLSASRLVRAGDARASRYHQVILAAAAEAANGELDVARQQLLLTPARRAVRP